jgi:hypothetical protein
MRFSRCRASAAPEDRPGTSPVCAGSPLLHLPAALEPRFSRTGARTCARVRPGHVQPPSGHGGAVPPGPSWRERRRHRQSCKSLSRAARAAACAVAGRDSEKEDGEMRPVHGVAGSQRAQLGAREEPDVRTTALRGHSSLLLLGLTRCTLAVPGALASRRERGGLCADAAADVAPSRPASRCRRSSHAQNAAFAPPCSLGEASFCLLLPARCVLSSERRRGDGVQPAAAQALSTGRAQGPRASVRRRAGHVPPPPSA